MCVRERDKKGRICMFMYLTHNYYKSNRYKFQVKRSHHVVYKTKFIHDHDYVDVLAKSKLPWLTF